MKIVIDIKTDGTVYVYAENGVPGEACSLAVRKVAERLGVVLEEEHLPEFFAEETQPLTGKKGIQQT